MTSLRKENTSTFSLSLSLCKSVSLPSSSHVLMPSFKSLNRTTLWFFRLWVLSMCVKFHHHLCYLSFFSCSSSSFSCCFTWVVTLLVQEKVIRLLTFLAVLSLSLSFSFIHSSLILFFLFSRRIRNQLPVHFLLQGKVEGDGDERKGRLKLFFDFFSLTLPSFSRTISVLQLRSYIRFSTHDPSIFNGIYTPFIISRRLCCTLVVVLNKEKCLEGYGSDDLPVEWTRDPSDSQVHPFFFASTSLDSILPPSRHENHCECFAQQELVNYSTSKE